MSARSSADNRLLLGFMRMAKAQFPGSTSTTKQYRRQSLPLPRQRPYGGGVPSSAYFEPTSAAVPPQSLPPRSASGKGGMDESVGHALHSLTDQLREEQDGSKKLQNCMVELERKVESMEREIAKLKGSETPITPDLIPQGEEDYYRLQLDQVDRLGAVQLANIVKNMLILFNTPLSKVQSFIPALAKILNEEDHYMDFANRVHEALFRKPIASPQDTEAVKKCLDKMILQISRR